MANKIRALNPTKGEHKIAGMEGFCYIGNGVFVRDIEDFAVWHERDGKRVFSLIYYE